MISIRETYMTHSGGTKFYRAFLISNIRDERYGSEFDLASSDPTLAIPIRSLPNFVTAIHFGPMKSAGAPIRARPVMGGQVQIKFGKRHYEDQVTLKATANAKGVYVKEGPETENLFIDGTAAQEELLRLFGSTTAREISAMLNFSTGGSETSPDTPKDNEVSIEAPKEKPAHWGLW